MLLSALHPCLSHAFLETVVAILFEVAAEFRSEDPSVTLISPRQLCADLKEHLQDRQAARQTARKCETPWYPAPSVSYSDCQLYRAHAFVTSWHFAPNFFSVSNAVDTKVNSGQLVSTPKSSGSDLAISGLHWLMIEAQAVSQLIASAHLRLVLCFAR